MMRCSRCSKGRRKKEKKIRGKGEIRLAVRAYFE